MLILKKQEKKINDFLGLMSLNRKDSKIRTAEKIM